MKLNIEELAREADLSPMTADSHCRVDYWTATKIELEIFARLIVKRCAQECEKERAEFMDQAGRNDGRESDMAFGSVNSAERIAAAIRNLLED